MMDKFPMEVTTHILSKLPITSVFGCRSVSKTWCSIIDNPQFPNLYFHDYVSKSRNPSSSSFILVPTSTTYQVKLYDLEDSPFASAFQGVGSSSNPVLTSSKINIPPNLSKDSPMLNINTVGSSHGLICLSSLQSTPNNPNLYVYNPVIREHVQLPLPHDNFVISIKASGFGFDPSTNEFKVVLICQWRQWNEGEEEEDMDEEEYGPIQLAVQVYSFGEGRRLGGSNSWRNVDWVQMDSQVWISGDSSVTINNKLHWITMNDNDDSEDPVDIVSFDLEHETFGIVPHFESIFLPHSVDIRVAVLEGCLSLIGNLFGEYEIWVMKDYNIEDSWTKQFVVSKHLRIQADVDVVYPVCLRENGELVLLCDSRVLIACNVERGNVTHLEDDEVLEPEVDIDQSYKVFPYIGSFISPKSLHNSENDI